MLEDNPDTPCCPRCHSQRVEFTENECICFKCGLTQERYDFPLSEAWSAYYHPSLARPEPEKVTIKEWIPPNSLAPIKAEINYLRRKLEEVVHVKKTKKIKYE